ncbi:MAG: Asp-tRNA(Asn)/Glu-tRNA(Gln) amidotransferase subunit GatA, partial [Clostridia bacterium]|nr:Asp-tRNA(Asn)/Glu-tRNA(Gln) amidotransferase subunit GatA [Clostridia bacterium]
MDLYKMTAHQLSDMLKNKEVSSTDITKSVIDRITSVDDKVKSYITVTADKALETAKAVDEKIAKGEEIAPLEGIPAGIKDNICTEGINTTCA